MVGPVLGRRGVGSVLGRRGVGSADEGWGLVRLGIGTEWIWIPYVNGDSGRN